VVRRWTLPPASEFFDHHLSVTFDIGSVPVQFVQPAAAWFGRSGGLRIEGDRLAAGPLFGLERNQRF
jgi:hypothetical protein